MYRYISTYLYIYIYTHTYIIICISIRRETLIADGFNDIDHHI